MSIFLRMSIFWIAAHLRLGRFSTLHLEPRDISAQIEPPTRAGVSGGGTEGGDKMIETGS